MVSGPAQSFSPLGQDGLRKRRKVQDLHFHNLRHRIAESGSTARNTIGTVRPTTSSDSLGTETMTARYSHRGHGWNQQLRHAVTLLERYLLEVCIRRRQFKEATPEEPAAHTKCGVVVPTGFEPVSEP